MKQRTFEEELEQGRKILEKLTDPEITLEESVHLYEQGLKSIRKAQKMLEEARLKVETIEKELHDNAEEEKEA